MDIDISLVVAITALISTAASFIRQAVLDSRDKKKRAYELEEKKEGVEKVKAEADEINVSTALSLVTPLKQRIIELEEELKKVMEELKEIEKLLTEKDKIIEQMKKKEEELQNRIMKLETELRYFKDRFEECQAARNHNPPV